MTSRLPKIFLIFLFVLVGLFLIYPTVNAAGLVPCGRLSGTPEEMRPCTTCDIFALGSRVINFALFTLVPAIAVLFYLWAGFMVLLGGANPGLVKTGYGIFRTTTYGLLIIFGAWMITNMVLKSLVGDKDISNNWFRIECTATVQQPPPVQRYTCGSLGCVAKSDGEYTEPTCGGKCAAAEKKYSCEGTQCILDYSGPYTSSDCDNECGLPADCVDIDENGQINEIDCGAPENEKCSLCFAPPGPTVLTIAISSLPDALVNTRYNATITASGGKAPYSFSITSGTLPPGMLMAGNGTITGTPATTGTYSFTIKVEDSSTPTKQSAIKQLSIKISPLSALPSCPPTGDLCQPGSTTCTANACSQYSSATSQAAAKISISGFNSSSIIRSIMFSESTCNVSAYNFVDKTEIDPKTGREVTVKVESCGLMQMQLETAGRFDTRCGLRDKSVTCDFLRNPANINAIVCLGAKYIESIANGTCSNQVRNIAAGYNAGIGNCTPDPECASSKSCDGGAVRKWECPYDRVNNQVVCNTRLNETRTYAPKVLACYNKQ